MGMKGIKSYTITEPLIVPTYLHYRVYNSVLYKMGTEGVSKTQFAREVYTSPQPPLEVNVDDHNLNLFVRDVPFNFALEQALDKLEDPGVLTEVAQLQMIVAHILIYSELAHSIQNSQMPCISSKRVSMRKPVNWSSNSRPLKDEWKPCESDHISIALSLSLPINTNSEGTSIGQRSLVYPRIPTDITSEHVTTCKQTHPEASNEMRTHSTNIPPITSAVSH